MVSKLHKNSMPEKVPFQAEQTYMKLSFLFHRPVTTASGRFVRLGTVSSNDSWVLNRWSYNKASPTTQTNPEIFNNRVLHILGVHVVSAWWPIYQFIKNQLQQLCKTAELIKGNTPYWVKCSRMDQVKFLEDSI